MALHLHTVYGLTIHSEIPLPLPSGGDGSLGHVRLRMAPTAFFDEAVGPHRHQAEWAGWFQYLPLPDGGSYVRGWGEMGELLVSADGHDIVCAPESGTLPESFYVYLLGQGLSFALLKQGLEPLHATAVVVDGQAVALVADSGGGKSTLAAAFVAAGCAVLTDDVLVVVERDEQVLAFPGPGRLKLFPKVAHAVLDRAGQGTPMNTVSAKRVLALDAEQSHGSPVPLAAIYEVTPPRGTPGRQDVSISPVPPRDAALAMVQAAFNQRLVTRQRLERQFQAAANLAERVPVRRLSYPRQLARLPDVVKAVVADVATLRATQAILVPSS